MNQEKGDRTITKEITLVYPVEKVWDTLTNPEELRRWFPLEAEVDLRENGVVKWDWPDKYFWELIVEKVDSPEYLKLKYSPFPPLLDRTIQEQQEIKSIPISGDREETLTIEFFLKSDKGKTILRIVHSGFGEGETWDDMYDSTSIGWDSQLINLKHYLRFHQGEDRDVVWLRTQISMDSNNALLKIYDSVGLNIDEALVARRDKNVSLESKSGDKIMGDILSIESSVGLSMKVNNMNNAILRIWIDEWTGKRYANLFLSVYGMDKDYVNNLRARWSDHLSGL